MPRIITSLNLEVYEFDLLLPRAILGYTRDNEGERTLKRLIGTSVAPPTMTPQNFSNVDIQTWCELYNESKVAAIYETVEKHFQSLGSLVPPWAPGRYVLRTVPAPIDIIGRLGEGISGYYFEDRGYRWVYRPRQTSPDCYMTNGNEMAVIEVKTSSTAFAARGRGAGGLTANVKGAMTALMRFWASMYHFSSYGDYTLYAVNVELLAMRGYGPAGSDLDAVITIVKWKVSDEDKERLSREKGKRDC